MKLPLLVALVIALLFISGLLSSGSEDAKFSEQELIQYEYSLVGWEVVPDKLKELYNNLSPSSSVTYNGTRVTVDVIANDYRVEYNGYTFTAYMGVYGESGVEKTGKAKILLLKMNYEKVPETGTPLVIVTVKSPLLSLFTLSNATKDVELPVIAPVLLLESGKHMLPRKLILNGECYFDTSSENTREGICMFIYPENDRPKEVIVTVVPEKGDISNYAFAKYRMGYPVGRIPLE